MTVSVLRFTWGIVQVASVLFFVVMPVGFMIWGAQQWSEGAEGAWGVFLLFLIISVSGVVLIVYVAIKFGKHEVVMRKFAKDNGFEFLSTTALDPARNGVAFSSYARPITRNIVSGSYQGRVFRLFEYRFITGRYPNIFTVLTIQLHGSYNQTLVVNKKGNLRVLTFPDRMKPINSPWLNAKNLSVYSMDGKFDDGVFEILNQQRINNLLDISPKIELEIYDGSIAILIPNRPIASKDSAPKLFALMKNLGPKV
ncbi:hypothetical protein E6P97_01195 [Patescibacteria group bacterium]|nr:MAG: hypothetical protein E6P97_01195 [Patescibacteria group bacterium]